MSRQQNFHNLIVSAGLIVVLSTLIPSQSLRAQGELDLGATTVSRYLWRGIQFDNSVNFQPYMMYYTSKFEIGASSSMSLTNDFNEIYFWAAYSVNTSLINAKFYVADFYYEYLGSDFTNFKTEKRDGVEGNHYVEGYVEFTSDNSPFKLLFSSSLWNDPDNSMYAEVSYSKSHTNDLESSFSLGGSLKKSSRWYYTEKAGIVNVSYELSKQVQITPEYALPVSVTSIFNPTGKSFYVVLAISI
jgi:hypothetical protein